MSERDQKWTEDVFNSAFGGKPFEEVGQLVIKQAVQTAELVWQLTPRDIGTIIQVFEAKEPRPPERTFAG